MWNTKVEQFLLLIFNATYYASLDPEMIAKTRVIKIRFERSHDAGGLGGMGGVYRESQWWIKLLCECLASKITAVISC